MPFFGRQGILAKTAAAGASGDRGYWQQATAVTSGNGNTNTAYAQFIKTSAITSNTRNVAISLWFKVSASDFDPDSGLFVLVSNYQGASSRWAIDFEQTGGITFYYSDGSVKSVSTGSLNSTFESTYVDGNWHHFFGQIQPGDSAKCKIYLDGADRTTNTSSMTGNAITADT